MGDGVGYQAHLAFPGNLLHDLGLADSRCPDEKNGTLCHHRDLVLPVLIFQKVSFYCISNLFFRSLNIHNLSPRIAKIHIHVWIILLLQILTVQNQFNSPGRHINVLVILLHENESRLVRRHFGRIDSTAVCKIDQSPKLCKFLRPHQLLHIGKGRSKIRTPSLSQ